MIIHVVQPGENIRSIAEIYGVTEEKIITDNALINPNELVPGQTLVIVFPEKTYIVQQGDTLQSIATMHNVSVMQLLRNNPSLTNREYIYPGEIVISYNTRKSLKTYGFCYPFIDESTLRKTLPNLTFLSVINYRALENGDLSIFYDDTQTISICKEYGTIPLLMISTLNIRGMEDYELLYTLLLNEDYLNNHINQLIQTVKEKGYLGVNFVFSFLSTDNQLYYINLLSNASRRLRAEGYIVHVAINPRISNINGEIVFEEINYTEFSKYADSITFIQPAWSLIYGPPRPVSSAENLNSFVNYAIKYVPAEKFVLGMPILAYDWIIPYSPDSPYIMTLTLNSALGLAVDVKATINFDEASQSPFFEYNLPPLVYPVHHIVWFVDARSFAALLRIIDEHNLSGVSIWNIMVYVPQLWLMINSEYDIIKLLPYI